MIRYFVTCGCGAGFAIWKDKLTEIFGYDVSSADFDRYLGNTFCCSRCGAVGNAGFEIEENFYAREPRQNEFEVVCRCGHRKFYSEIDFLVAVDVLSVPAIQSVTSRFLCTQCGIRGFIKISDSRGAVIIDRRAAAPDLTGSNPTSATLAILNDNLATDIRHGEAVLPNQENISDSNPLPLPENRCLECGTKLISGVRGGYMTHKCPRCLEEY